MEIALASDRLAAAMATNARAQANQSQAQGAIDLFGREGVNVLLAGARVLSPLRLAFNHFHHLVRLPFCPP